MKSYPQQGRRWLRMETDHPKAPAYMDRLFLHCAGSAKYRLLMRRPVYFQAFRLLLHEASEYGGLESLGDFVEPVAVGQVMTSLRDLAKRVPGMTKKKAEGFFNTMRRWGILVGDPSQGRPTIVGFVDYTALMSLELPDFHPDKVQQGVDMHLGKLGLTYGLASTDTGWSLTEALRQIKQKNDGDTKTIRDMVAEFNSISYSILPTARNLWLDHTRAQGRNWAKPYPYQLRPIAEELRAQHLEKRAAEFDEWNQQQAEQEAAAQAWLDRVDDLRHTSMEAAEPLPDELQELAAEMESEEPIYALDDIDDHTPLVVDTEADEPTAAEPPPPPDPAPDPAPPPEPEPAPMVTIPKRRGRKLTGRKLHPARLKRHSAGRQINNTDERLPPD